MHGPPAPALRVHAAHTLRTHQVPPLLVEAVQSPFGAPLFLGAPQAQPVADPAAYEQLQRAQVRSHPARAPFTALRCRCTALRRRCTAAIPSLLTICNLALRATTPAPPRRTTSPCACTLRYTPRVHPCCAARRDARGTHRGHAAQLPQGGGERRGRGAPARLNPRSSPTHSPPTYRDKHTSHPHASQPPVNHLPTPPRTYPPTHPGARGRADCRPPRWLARLGDP